MPSSSNSQTLLALWAKTDRRNPDSGTYHPLICHMIDVAMVARAMWHDVLTPALQRRIAAGLGFDDVDIAGAWIAFLAGLHDIGKASPGFQAKWPASRNPLAANGLTWSGEPPDPGHGIVSSVALELLLPKRGVPEGIAPILAVAIGGHHGVLPSSLAVDTARISMSSNVAMWAATHDSLADELAMTVNLPDGVAASQIDHPTAMTLAGLVSVADWIGSDERYFQYRGNLGNRDALDLTRYADDTQSQAQTALGKLGWLGWKPSTDSRAFEDLFPAITDPPRPVQTRIVELPGILNGPGIVIVELPMGEGKTEAAFYLADRWGVEIQQRGMYVAMPTMATSDQMFTRAHEFLSQRYPVDIVNLQRLHSHAALSVDLEAEQAGDGTDADAAPADVRDNEAEGQTGAVAAAEWFTRRKRGLLAPFGVGTVDQSLLAVLQTRHVFVRLFGLAGKTVIFDEVHAYDVYMSTLFERLLEWLGALGSSVIVLSATLPNARRRELLAKYAKGAGLPIEGTIQDAPYPRLSWLGSGRGRAESVIASERARRALHIEWLADRDAELAKLLNEKLERGGCAAVICNTVGRAQAVYQALQPRFPDTASDELPMLDLFHARFLFKDREAREDRALRRFGKPREDVVRPEKAILVATQVIEQSLDLDFDVMVTDLAPIDLLLQRSGRLQRHDRGPREPVLWVIRPEENEDGAPRFEHSDEFIYDPHILLRTWLALGSHVGNLDKPIRVPDDIERLIEFVYNLDLRPPTDLPEQLSLRWTETLAAYQADTKHDADEAKRRWLRHPYYSGEIANLAANPRQEDASDFHREHQALTRLTERTEGVICLRRTGDGTAVSPDGKESFLLTSTPDTETARRLLRYAVGVRHRAFVREVEALMRPRGWEGSTLLRHHWLALLDDHSRKTAKGWTLRLDQDLGVMIER